MTEMKDTRAMDTTGYVMPEQIAVVSGRIVEAMACYDADLTTPLAGFEDAEVVGDGLVQFAMDGDWYVLTVGPAGQ